MGTHFSLLFHPLPSVVFGYKGKLTQAPAHSALPRAMSDALTLSLDDSTSGLEAGRGAGAAAHGPLDEPDDRINFKVIALKAALLNEKVVLGSNCGGLGAVRPLPMPPLLSCCLLTVK
jgi:hypothetical protein